MEPDQQSAPREIQSRMKFIDEYRDARIAPPLFGHIAM